MRNKFQYLLGILGLLFFGVSCADILVPDLSEEVVQLKGPVSGLETAQQSQTFWWEELDLNVDGYRLEIVTPSFDSVVRLVEQIEIIEGNTHQLSLDAGIYQWTVVGFNESSESQAMIHDLIISDDSTANLSSQNLILVGPEENLVTNMTSVNFLWQELEDASAYKIQVASPDFSNSTFFVVNETVSADNYSTTLAEGEYRWRVRAENESSISPYSENTLTIDLTPPQAPNLLSPIANDSISLPVTLTWEVDPQSKMDTLYVYTDSSLNTLVLKQATTATFFELNGLTEQEDYYWRLRSVDEAGNTGAFSVSQRFYVND